MADSTMEYSNEKIFVDSAADAEKEVLAGPSGQVSLRDGRKNDTMETSASEKEAVPRRTSDDGLHAEEKVAVGNDPEEKVAVTNQTSRDPENLITVSPAARALAQAFTEPNGPSGKRAVSPDTVPSPIDHPPSYMSPTTRISSPLFPTSHSPSYREYAFYHTAPWRPTHNTIVDPENCARYFVEVSEFTKGKFDVAFHDVRSSNASLSAKREGLSAEEGKGCPVVAFAQFPRGKREEVRFGIGDGEGDSETRWGGMRREEGPEYWLMVLGEGGEGGRRFEWRAGRVGSVASAGDDSEVASPISETNSTISPDGTSLPGTIQLVDTESREMLALYTELKIGRSLKKRGKLRLYESTLERAREHEKDVELLVMLSVASMNEKRRRKTWRKWAMLGAGGK